MKLLCDVCEKSVASVICCADEAALCLPCDASIHAANKLASKHLRIAVLADSVDPPSSCDICQERPSLFFCIEDRAILCRECDLSIHSTNAVVAKHRRFLLTGVKVGMDAMSAVTVGTATSSSQEETIISSMAVDNTTTNNNMNINSEQQQAAVTPAEQDVRVDDVHRKKKGGSRSGGGGNVINSSKKRKPMSSSSSSMPSRSTGVRASPSRTHSAPQSYDTIRNNNRRSDDAISENRNTDGGTGVPQIIHDHKRTYEGAAAEPMTGGGLLAMMIDVSVPLQQQQRYAGGQAANGQKGETAPVVPRTSIPTTSTVDVQQQQQQRWRRKKEEVEGKEGAVLLRPVPRVSIQRLSTGSIAFMAPVLSTLQVPCNYEEEEQVGKERGRREAENLEMEKNEREEDDGIGAAAAAAHDLLEWRLEDLLSDLGDMCESGHPASPQLASCC